MLEEYVSILVRTTCSWVLRIQCMFTECFNSIHWAHFFQIFVIPFLNLLNLMGSTETIKEVNEWNFSFQSRQMSNRTQVHNFLWVCLSKHSETSLTTSIYITMITKNIQSMCRHRTCGYVEYAWQHLTSDFIHIRDHKKKTLRSRKCRCQSSCCKRTVYSTSGAGLRFHLNNFYFAAKNVLLSCCWPLINGVSHWARRCNRIDTSYFCIGICHVCCCGITIHGLFCSSHFCNVLLKFIHSCFYFITKKKKSKGRKMSSLCQVFVGTFLFSVIP